jgi:hypothetical protein
LIQEETEIRCLKLMLRPIIRFCVRRALTVRVLLDAAKAVFIEVAKEEMIHNGERVNTSRLSVMTGMQRRDVMRFESAGVSPVTQVGLAARVIGQWEQDPRFQTKKGKARILSLDGEESEFRQLVETISKDLNPGTVLFELQRLGVVDHTHRGLRLAKGWQLLHDNVEEGYLLAAQDADDLLSAVHENLESKNDTLNLHGRTEYDQIYYDALPEIRAWLIQKGVEFHTEVRTYLAQFDRDINPMGNKAAGARVIVGAFSRTLSPETDQTSLEETSA